jgi:O-antigen/teichoic acid export membrane protein
MSNPEEYNSNSTGGPQRIIRPGRRYAISVLSGAGNTIVIAGLGALAIRLITVHVGPSKYGLFVTALAFISSVMLLTDLGVNSITGREIARSPQDAADILGHNLGLRLTLSIVLIPILAFIGIAIYPEPELRWSIALLSVSIPFDALRTISLGYYVASIRNYVSAGVLLLQQVLFVVGVIIALKCGFGIAGCAASYLAASFVSGVLAFLVVRREVNFKPLYNMKKWRHVFGLSMSLGAIQAINILYLKADTLILSRIATPHAVGLYGVAYSFTTFFLVVPSLVMTSAMPLLATAIATEFSELVRRSLHALAILGAGVGLLAVLFAPQAITILSGRHFLGAAGAMRILALACFFTFLNAALGWAAVACNRHHRIITVSVFGLILNVALNLVLIPRFGINGAAASTLISEFFTLLGVRIVFSQIVGANVSLLRSSFLPVAAGGLVIVFGHFVLFRGWQPPTSTIFWAPVLFLIFLAVLAILGGLPEEMMFVRKTLGRASRRNQN